MSVWSTFVALSFFWRMECIALGDFVVFVAKPG